MTKQEFHWAAEGLAGAADLPVRLAEIPAVSRNDSLVRFLAAADDWKAAGRRLGGAFAKDEAIRSAGEKEE